MFFLQRKGTEGRKTERDGKDRMQDWSAEWAEDGKTIFFVHLIARVSFHFDEVSPYPI